MYGAMRRFAIAQENGFDLELNLPVVWHCLVASFGVAGVLIQAIHFQLVTFLIYII